MIKEVTGNIDHRILLNYRIDPDIASRNLPDNLEPKVINGYAIGGICQVSLSGMRPKGLPSLFGTRSHNAAHRIAVSSQGSEGVYVPRRDTSSWANVLAGGRLFAGTYHHAKFNIEQSANHFRVEIKDDNHQKLMFIDAQLSDEISSTSVFDSIDEISQFFLNGQIGWSARPNDTALDAIELKTENWNMHGLAVTDEFSSFFTDTSKFPQGSAEFDSALIMRNINHSWISRGLNKS